MPAVQGSAPAGGGLTPEQLADLATDDEVAALIADLQAADSDLAAIAALSTTAYGRALLTLADDAGAQSSLDVYSKAEVDAAVAGAGGGGGSVFKQTIYTGTTNPTRSTDSFADIDATLYPALSLDLAVDDVVDLRFHATCSRSATGIILGFDWLIDRPTSADTTIRASGSKGAAWLWESPNNSIDAVSLDPVAAFVATEAGTHTFRPQWRPFSGTVTILNNDANYSTPSWHRVTNLGSVTA